MIQTKLTMVSKYSTQKEVITLTMGDCAENGVGMQKISRQTEPCDGFTRTDFEKIQKRLEESDVKTELITLSSGKEPDASVFVIRNGVNVLLGNRTHVMMYDEQKSLIWDTKKRIYGRVVNSQARYNLCYSDQSQEPDYVNGKGRIISFNDVPLMTSLMDKLEELVGPKASNLSVEGNRYYDITKCGISPHGDAERKICIGVRLGTVSLPLHYKWYLNSESYGPQYTIQLHPGDIYFMSEKAVGKDWKKKNIPTLRHATGASKYVVF